jgi:DNA-directed RNA polymerase subunit RPC12/RpoP
MTVKKGKEKKMKDKEQPLVDYTCKYCHKIFKVKQGSQKKYCPECLSKVVAREISTIKES